jgi:hypothetical protein
MPDFEFRVDSVEPLAYAMSPHLVFKVAVSNEIVTSRFKA